MKITTKQEAESFVEDQSFRLAATMLTKPQVVAVLCKALNIDTRTVGERVAGSLFVRSGGSVTVAGYDGFLICAESLDSMKRFATEKINEELTLLGVKL